MKNSNQLPKKIWFMWLQGIERAPEIVTICHDSWVTKNPGWEVIVLSEENLSEYISGEILALKHKSDIKIQHFSDICRINILADLGGVWVDATCLCMKPLDEWVYSHSSPGFFAYAGHRKDVMMSNWLMVSQPGCYLTKRLRDVVTQFWVDSRYPQVRNSRLYRILKWLLNRNTRTTKYWFNPFVSRVLKVCPYFCFHYLFAKEYYRDKSFRKIWDSVPNIDGRIPHKILFAGMLDPLTEAMKRDLDRREDLVFKLTWKDKSLRPSSSDFETRVAGTNLAYAIQLSNHHGG